MTIFADADAFPLNDQVRREIHVMSLHIQSTRGGVIFRKFRTSLAVVLSGKILHFGIIELVDTPTRAVIVNESTHQISNGGASVSQAGFPEKYLWSQDNDTRLSTNHLGRIEALQGFRRRNSLRR